MYAIAFAVAVKKRRTTSGRLSIKSEDTATPSEIVDGFLVVVVGGVGSLLGSVLSAGMLGEINGVVASVTNDIVARAVVFGVVILIIVAKPKGLFSFKER